MCVNQRTTIMDVYNSFRSQLIVPLNSLRLFRFISRQRSSGYRIIPCIGEDKVFISLTTSNTITSLEAINDNNNAAISASLDRPRTAFPQCLLTCGRFSKIMDSAARRPFSWSRLYKLDHWRNCAEGDERGKEGGAQ
ncbi:hypothetical protein Tcan_03164 [Toxocara canis]|uniref:Uncharacterized protein n=1 Tax=Toxocara canis TaxID=6265 RepID=A0A0B2VDJ3_TOXCA|nr:hypothetical protein Tcan_03164 [Toxocara canis]